MAIDLTGKEWKKLDDIIFLINSTSSVKTIQEEVLSELYPLVPYESASFYLPDDTHNTNLIGSPVVKNWDQQGIQDYLEYFQKVDYALWVFRLRESLVYRDTDLVQDSLRQKTEFYNDFLRSKGLYYAGGISIIHNQILCGALTLFRSKKSDDFSSKEMDILSHLKRHLGNRMYQLLYTQTGALSSPVIQHLESTEHGLTNRERQIAELIYQGLDTVQIATVLYISPKTVKKHLDNLFKKVNIHSRVELVKILAEVHNAKVLPGE